jgi:Kef-type K+ transport system membrane component KefB
VNPELMQTKLRATVAISHASIAAPFLLGSALALYLYPRFSTAGVSFTSFALFTGVAMSITAFPVLARILADLRLTNTELGSIALTCAAVDDVTAWCLLAFVAGVVQADSANGASVVALSVAFAVLMFGVVRPLLRAWRRRVRDAEPTRTQVALMIVGVLAAAAATEAIGVHALFGAFLFGVIVPRDGPLVRALAGSLEGMVTIVLLPAFFALAGMRTQIGLLSDLQAWIACGLIVIVATTGKVGATFVAARFGNLRPRAAAALGVLMNTRGLMQLIALNLGLELGVVTPTVFTMMVVMAVVTTVATPPILRRLINLPASTRGEMVPASRHA